MAELFRRLAARDHRAFNEIVTHLWGRLRAIAKVRLKHQPRLAAAYDEEDAVQSGVTRMWEAILAGQQSPPDGVDEFLRLARTIIARRIMARARAERTGKRNPASNPEPAWSAGPLGPYMPDDLNVFQCGRPGPEAEAIARDQTEWLLSLVDPSVRQIAAWRLDGFTVNEIATISGRPRRTVQREFARIRKIWRRALYEAIRSRARRVGATHRRQPRPSAPRPVRISSRLPSDLCRRWLRPPLRSDRPRSGRAADRAASDRPDRVSGRRA